MTMGAPKIAVTELMLTSVGAKGRARDEVAEKADTPPPKSRPEA